MKISIITPIYNEEKNIKRYFRAINKIDYPKNDFEILLINDGSISIYLARKLKDFFIVFLLTPILGTAFLMGIIKGLILKLWPQKS